MSGQAHGDDEILLESPEVLPPYDFGKYSASFYMCKFSWAAYGMSAFLEALSFAAKKQPQVQRRDQMIQDVRAGGKARVVSPKNSAAQNIKKVAAAKAASQQQLPSRRHSSGSTIPQQQQQKLQQKSSSPSTARKHSQSSVPTNSNRTVRQQQQQPPHHLSRLPYPPQYTAPGKGVAGQAKQPPPPTLPQQQKPPYSSVPSAATKPIRRLAKVRPYANQAIPVSADEIFMAIPREASSYFHIMDRRINLDAFANNDQDNHADNKRNSIPVYSLLRAWVQDDPCRQVPSSSFHVLLENTDDGPLAAPSRSSSTTTTSGKRSRDEEGSTNAKKQKREALDLTGYIATSNKKTKPPLAQLREQMVQSAKETRKKKAKPKPDLDAVLDRLRQR